MPKFVVVVAKYKEDVAWIADVKQELWLYDKSKGSIPNVGREAETYLRFIVEAYDNFPDFVVFLQGNPWDHIAYERDYFLDVLNNIHLSTDTSTSHVIPLDFSYATIIKYQVVYQASSM